MDGERQIPVLAKSWYENVDLLILEDMKDNWGVKADPGGRFGVRDSIRRRLHSKWVRTYDGWALSRNRKEIIYDFGEFDEWRETFETKHQVEGEETEGIGQFGI